MAVIFLRPSCLIKSVNYVPLPKTLSLFALKYELLSFSIAYINLLNSEDSNQKKACVGIYKTSGSIMWNRPLKGVTTKISVKPGEIRALKDYQEMLFYFKLVVFRLFMRILNLFDNR